MGTKRNYSLTKDKFRLNDTFLLNVTGNTGGGQYGDSLHYFPEIMPLNDWSIVGSFSLKTLVNGSNVILDTRRQSGTINGIYINVKEFEFTLITGWNSASVVWDYTFSLNRIYNFCLNYNSTTKILNLDINTRNIGDMFYNENWTTEPENGLIMGRLAFENFGQKSITLNNIATFKKQLPQNEKNYIYQTGELEEDSHESCMFHVPFKNVVHKSNDKRIRKKLNTNNTNDNWVRFNVIPVVSDVFTSICKAGLFFKIGTGNIVANSCFWGFTDSPTPVTSGFNTAMFVTSTTTNNITVIENGSIVYSAPVIYGDVYKLEILTATTIGAYINNVLVYTFTGVNLATYKLFCKVQNTVNSPLSDIERNNISLHDDSFVDQNIEISLNDAVMMNVVANYNYAKTIPIPKSEIYHLGFGGFSDNEMGLNAGTSTFTAYSDFYTKTPALNFTGGGDSVIYKSKELRKYGIRLDGTQYFSILNLSQFDVNKGITILVGIADIDLTGSLKEFIHLTDSNSNRVITLEYDDVSSNILFKSGDIAQDTQSVEIDKTASNFAVYRISADQNKYSNGLFTKSAGVNTVDTTRLNTTLNRTDATYNIYLGSGNAGASPLDCVVTYFAMFEGVLNDAEVKPYFNNGIFSNVSDLSQTTKSTLIVATDFNNPFDDLGVLKVPDLSSNNEEIVVTGFANITDLENAKVENLSLI